MSDHAEYSCSAAERWLNCPGSMALGKNAPPQSTSKYAAEGTLAHECLEFALRYGETRIFPDKFNEDMIKHALDAHAWMCEQNYNNPGDILCEQKVDTSPFICEGQFGTLDAAIVREFGRLTVVDYKYGAGYAVEPQDNPQLIAYALALSHQYHHNFTEVELVIIQPRAYHESGETIRTALYTMGEILEWEKKFKAGYKATLDPFAPLNPGNWCKFCPAAVICPELKDKAAKDAQMVFSETTGELQSVPEPLMIRMPALSNALKACDKLELWIEKVREHATHLLEQGGMVEGYKLVQKRSIRKWVDHEKVTTEAKLSFGAKAFTEPELLSPAQFEKALKSKTGIEAWVKARVTAESSGTTLVKESDKREAVNPIAKVFSPQKILDS